MAMVLPSIHEVGGPARPPRRAARCSVAHPQVAGGLAASPGGARLHVDGHLSGQVSMGSREELDARTRAVLAAVGGPDGIGWTGLSATLDGADAGAVAPGRRVHLGTFSGLVRVIPAAGCRA